MKKIILTLSIIISAISHSIAQTNDIAILRTNTEKIRVSVNGAISEEEIPLSDYQSDTLRIPIIVNPLNFTIYSDIDSIKTQIPINTEFTFKIQKKDRYPFVLIIRNGIEIEQINFDSINKNTDLHFAYESGLNNSYLEKLKANYPIDSIASTAKNDFEKVKTIASWVHGLWEHDGYNTPKQNDALYILNEVKAGQRFRCVEYGIVTTACLNAIGLPSRTLSLKTKNAESTPSGAGHVVMEVFLKDMNKWIMVDPQWDAIPWSKGKPLNAVEFQKAITDKCDIEILTNNKELNKYQYEAWIYSYLYYFSYKFDNRENIPKDKRITINDKSELMLVPKGAKKPTIFQRKFPIDYCLYTNSILDFYRSPI